MAPPMTMFALMTPSSEETLNVYVWSADWEILFPLTVMSPIAALYSAKPTTTLYVPSACATMSTWLPKYLPIICWTMAAIEPSASYATLTVYALPTSRSYCFCWPSSENATGVAPLLPASCARAIAGTMPVASVAASTSEVPRRTTLYLISCFIPLFLSSSNDDQTRLQTTSSECRFT